MVSAELDSKNPPRSPFVKGGLNPSLKKRGRGDLSVDRLGIVHQTKSVPLH
jgi:hypothetical protein